MTVRLSTLACVLLIAACGGSEGASDAAAEAAPDSSGAPDGDVVVAALDVVDVPPDLPVDADVPWVFDPEDYERVHGWILLDDDPEAVAETIDAAAAFGVNHIQLSHALIDYIDDVIGDAASTLARVETLNAAIAQAHGYGMKVYVWAHEFANGAADVCYDPADPFWSERAQTYRDAFDRLPGLDGVVMMFGSASPPPWLSFCLCDWCLDRGDDPIAYPTPQEKLQRVVERIGGPIADAGKELVVRTFVHDPAEIAWHSDGLTAVEGVPFTGMHKGPVQDWQPYNPHHPCTGHVGPHPSIVELDVAGEYYGLSVLPFCAPGYYRFRLDHMWRHRGIGAVLRVQRGSNHALGTPNQINMLAVQRFIEDPGTALDDIWAEFIAGFYGLAPEHAAQPVLRRILADTFPIRRKSHYVLGIWALDKGSDLPDGPKLDRFNGRGEMPRWDPDWQAIWDRLDVPDVEVVRWIWQEGTEAVALAADARAACDGIADALAADRAADLARRLLHQWLAARAWRAVDLFLWSRRAQLAREAPLAELDAWQAWSFAELGAIRDAMVEGGLEGIGPAGPASVQRFMDGVAGSVPAASAAAPSGLSLSPIRVTEVAPTSARLTFTSSEAATVIVDYGLEIPDYGHEVSVDAPGGEPVSVVLDDLGPNQRWVARLRVDREGARWQGGDFWIFTPRD